MTENNFKLFDFELIFEKDCDVDNVISEFFKNNDTIKGDKEYITYKIKKIVDEDRKFLTGVNEIVQDHLNKIGKFSFLKHHVIPEQNNGNEYYTYRINSFIS
jgi:hypothetical protein